MRPLVEGSAVITEAWEGEANPELAVQHVLEAVRGLPASMKKDFQIAVEKCPEVVMTETNPLKFFRCEHGNSWAAALRLVQNWSLRRHVFGEEYWLLPTRLRGGALHPTDFRLLRTGAFVLLTPDVPQQRQVFIADFGRLQGLEEGTARQRLMFYVMVNCLNAYTQKHGVDVIVIINGGGMKIRNDNGHMMQATHTKTAFYMNRVILVRDPTDTRSALKHLFEKFLLSMLQKFWGNNLITVAEDSPHSTRMALERLGLHPSTFPKQLGGDWSYDQVDRWILQRLQVEERGGSDRQAEALDGLGSENGVYPEPNNNNADTSREIVAPDRSNRKRMKNSNDVSRQKARDRSALYSRRSYYRKKEEREQMTRQCDLLREENRRLREEEHHLESLLANALALITNASGVYGEPRRRMALR